MRKCFPNLYSIVHFFRRDLIAAEAVCRSWYNRLQLLWEDAAKKTFFISDFEMQMQRGSYKNVFATRIEMIRLAIRAIEKKQTDDVLKQKVSASSNIAF